MNEAVPISFTSYIACLPRAYHKTKVIFLCSTGVFAFFFFSGRVKAFENTAPTLNYYWVPILASLLFLFPGEACYLTENIEMQFISS